MRKAIIVSMLLMVVSCSMGASKAGNCPDKSKVKNSLMNVLQGSSVEVVNVSSVKEWSGLCEVFVKIDGEPRIFYVDQNARYLVTGNLIDLSERRNITRERMQEMDIVTSEYLKELEKHVNIEYKKGPRYIYVITDPDCPVCKRAEEPLISWANKNNVTLKIILMPIPELHPDAYAKSVAIVCENRTFSDYISRRFGNTTCDRGKKAIDSNMEFLRKLGVSGTPTFIGPKGKKIVGLPADINELDKLIN